MLIFAISASIIEASKEANSTILEEFKLQRVLYIYNHTQFNVFSIEGLIDADVKVNVMQLSLTKKLSFRTCKTNMGAWKIDGSRLEIYAIVIASF